MDVVYSGDLVDLNGLARNPFWQRQKQTGHPPDPNEFCPASSEDPNEWRSKADCTNAILHFNSSDFCSGHMNWFPVEYEGTITWGDHSTGLFDDDDYFLYVDRPDHALKTAASGDTRVGTEIEFDSGKRWTTGITRIPGGTVFITTTSIKAIKRRTVASTGRT